MSLTLLQLFEYGLLIFFVLSVLAAIPAFVVTARLKRRYGAARWLPTPAVVENSVIEQVGARPAQFAPAITYRYEFRGASYLSSTISPDLHGASSSDRSFAEKWVSLLPQGSHITAFVDETSPAIAVMFPESRNGWLFTLGVMFATFGFFSFVTSAMYFYAKYLH
ncbi:MAG: hypothetical protein FD131_1264 [Rhodocyclaceae bacterium]|nr:MAG: hypothetical protein FD131_1264 [Rhodocyclaceae bacterium]